MTLSKLLGSVSKCLYLLGSVWKCPQQRNEERTDAAERPAGRRGQSLSVPAIRKAPLPSGVKPLWEILIGRAQSCQTQLSFYFHLGITASCMSTFFTTAYIVVEDKACALLSVFNDAPLYVCVCVCVWQRYDKTKDIHISFPFIILRHLVVFGRSP